MPGIVWLASYPKSGNTWMRAFLANYIEGATRPLRINDLPKYGLGDSRWDCFEPFAEKPLAAMTLAEIAALRPKVQDWFAQSAPGQVFVKTHNIIARVAGIPLIAPGATMGAIYIVRNPLDVCVSFAHHFRIPMERAVGALCKRNNRLPRDDKTLPQHIGSWAQNVSTWVNAEGMILQVTRYEDMLTAPEESFGAVVEFLDMPLDRERLRRAISFASFEELQKQEEEGRFVEGHEDGRRFFREGRAGAWRRQLTHAQVERIVEANRRPMMRFGYLDEAGNPL